MTAINLGKDSFRSFIAFRKMGSMRVTSCNLLPGSNVIMVDPEIVLLSLGRRCYKL